MMLLVALTLFTATPDTLHLEACYRDAAAHSPLGRQVALQGEIAALNLATLRARFLPSVSVGGQATYHSEVATLPVSAPGFTPPQISHDQYKVALSVNQLIYDGGLTAEQQRLEAARRDLEQQQVAVALYQVRDQVDAAFLAVRLLEAQQASLTTLAADLRARQRVVEAQVAAGAGLPANADVLAAERLRVEQQQMEVAAQRGAARAVLSELLGRPVPEDAVLALPEVASVPPLLDARQRPEYRAFALTREQLARQAQLAARKNRPTLAGFAETAYGRPPGLNLFENAFTPFVTAGVRLSWTPWDWHTSRREQEALALRQEVVAAQEAAFAQALRVAVQQDLADMARLDALLRSDAEIVALRQRVADRAASQLDNGVITATDYLVERNAAHQAELTQQLHRIQRVQAQVRYRTKIGDAG